jgi:hypothetical protein
MGNVSYLHLIILFLDDQIAGSIKRRASGFKKLAGLSVLRATNIYIWDCGGRIVDRVKRISRVLAAPLGSPQLAHELFEKHPVLG